MFETVLFDREAFDREANILQRLEERLYKRIRKFQEEIVRYLKKKREGSLKKPASFFTYQVINNYRF